MKLNSLFDKNHGIGVTILDSETTDSGLPALPNFERQ